MWFAVARFITGFGIGGEYAAINSAGRRAHPRTRARLGGHRLSTGAGGSAPASGASLGFLYLKTLPSDIGWRVAFGMGLILAVGILMLRLWVPESPRWLLVHGREDEAEDTVEEIESNVSEQSDEELEEPPDDDTMELRERESTGFIEITKTLFLRYPRRTIVGLSLMGTQAFLYNAIFFTFGLMLTTFFNVDSTNVGLFLLPFAAGNFVGPLVLGPLFDRLGRRVMIPSTFGLAGVLTIVTGYLFAEKVIDSVGTITIAWVVIFFFASAGASAGYLTVSETFPLEIRAMAIAFFYAVATGIGGVAGPYVYGNLISSGNRWTMFWGYVIGGGLMLGGGLIHRFLGVEAAQQSLEDVAKPLSAEEDVDDERRDGDEGEEGEEREEGRQISPRPSFSGLPISAAPPRLDRDVEREVEVLARSLENEGPAGRRELQRRVRARHWGPGRFGRAVRTGVREGRIKKQGLRRYEAEGRRGRRR